jgi:hypothetical protein
MLRPFHLLLIAALLLVTSTPSPAEPIAFSMYDVAGGPRLYQIDLGTGVATPVSATLPFTPLSLAFTDRLVAAGRPTSTETRLYSFTQSGTQYTHQSIGSFGNGRASAAGLAFDQTTNTLYGLIPNIASQAALYRINTNTGAVTPITGANTNPYADGLAISSTGVGVATDALDPMGNGVYYQYGVNLANGTLNTPLPIDIDPNGDGYNGNSGLAYDGNGQLWLLSSYGAFYQLDPTLPGGVSGPMFVTDANGNELTSGSWHGLAFLRAPVAATPEPASVAVFGILAGLGSCSYLRTRRVRRT